MRNPVWPSGQAAVGRAWWPDPDDAAQRYVMTIMLRDRPDGMVEIVINRPVLIGIFPERDVAQRVCAFLQDDAIDWPEDRPARFDEAKADVAEAEASATADEPSDEEEYRLRELVERARNTPVAASTPIVPAEKPVRKLPAVIPDQPVAPVFLTPAPSILTEEQRAAAFKRIADGEKVADVAAEIGLSMGQLRGMWANHKRGLQSYLAEGGQVNCTGCKRLFTPSISQPDTCARCSHE